MPLIIEFPGLRPEVFTLPLFGMEFSLRWYALAYILGLLIGWRMVVWSLRRPALWPAGKAPMTVAQVEDLLTACILGVVVGGRLGFVLFYQPGHFQAHPLDIVKVWQGGMSFHGGFLGVVVAALWFARRRGVPALSLADALAFATPAGLFLGRVANFVNAELWGRPSTLPWAVVFPGAAAQDCPGITGPCARHPSQLYEAGLEGLLLGLVLLALVRGGALRRPGLVTGVFLAGYGLARFVVEFARQADPQFMSPENPWGHVALGLTMGQVLSLPMIVLGLALAVRAR